MRNFTTVHDVPDLDKLLDKALKVKKDPFATSGLGKHRTLGMIFLNPSLRTRMSTQKAAQNLGMNVISMNIDQDGWALELNDGTPMNGKTVEHVREAAAVMGEYCDILAIRCFPNLKNKDEDYGEQILIKFMKYCKKPIISLESATLHPLQSMADLITIKEHSSTRKPKVVLSWAPHIKPLPQAVPNSFAEWMNRSDVEFVITHPEGYELHEDYVKHASVTHDQDAALKDADFVYVKNWSSFSDYGKILSKDESWLINNKKLELTNDAKVMHCLPVRRGIELSDEILDGPSSLVVHQAANRVFAAQTVLTEILEHNFNPNGTAKNF